MITIVFYIYFARIILLLLDHYKLRKVKTALFSFKY